VPGANCFGRRLHLREDDRGQLWLLDWEDAGWGPPLADLVRDVVTERSLAGIGPSRIAGVVRSLLAGESLETLREVSTFWLSHSNLQVGDNDRTLSGRAAKDSARAAREIAALRVIASGE
jgi:aminoglycoside phosphotransferase (APT) family kinase protein